MTQLLEEKISSAEHIGNINTIGDISHILIRQPKSAVIRDYLVKLVSQRVTKLSLDNLQSAMYALNSSFTKTSPNDTSRLQQLEQDILKQFKSQPEGKYIRNITDRIFFLDIAFKRVPEALELQKDLLNQLDAKMIKSPFSIRRNEVAEIIVK